MNNEKDTSFENLNFYIDGELTRSDQLKIQDILKNNKDLAKTVKELQHNDQLICKLYNNIPEPKHAPYVTATKKRNKPLLTIISIAFIILIFYTGWHAI